MKLSFIILLSLGTAALAVHTNKPEPQPERSIINGAVSKASPSSHLRLAKDKKVLAACRKILKPKYLGEFPFVSVSACEWIGKHHPVDDPVEVDRLMDIAGYMDATPRLYLDFKTNEISEASPSSTQRGGSHLDGARHLTASTKSPSSEQSQRKTENRSSRSKPVSLGNYKMISAQNLWDKYFRTNALSMTPAGQRTKTNRAPWDALDKDQHSVVDLFWGPDQHPANDLAWMVDQNVKKIPTQDLREKQEVHRRQ